MPFMTLDLQTNYGNLDIVIKEVNRIQNLSQQINYNGAITIEKFSKEIYERIIETEEGVEQQKIDDRKREELEKKKKKRYLADGTIIYYDIGENEMNKKNIKRRFHSYEGNFVNSLK